MELATQPVNTKHRDAYYWRLVATAASFALFGLGGLCLRLVIFPLLACLPGDAEAHRQRARRTIGRLFWLFIRFMARSGVLTYEVEGAQKLGRPGQMIIANHPSLIDVVFLIGLVRNANCVVKQSLWQNPFTRGPIREAEYISNDGSMDMLDAAGEALRNGQTLVIFPEGTRTPPGQAPAFHRGCGNRLAGCENHHPGGDQGQPDHPDQGRTLVSHPDAPRALQFSRRSRYRPGCLCRPRPRAAGLAQAQRLFASLLH